MRIPIDFTNKNFGRLTPIKFSHRNKSSKSYWIFKCSCGKANVIIRLDTVLDGNTKSCGCLYNEIHLSNLKHFKSNHGFSKNPLYQRWRGMIERCYNPKTRNYHRYGGRGITVCKQWKNSFINFYKWAINHGFEKSLSLDRINNDKRYCPKNCRFISHKAQQNNRSSNRIISYLNKNKTISEWAEELKLEYQYFYYKLKEYNFVIKELIESPVMKVYGLDNKIYSLRLFKKIKGSCSNLHLRARNLLKKIFPLELIFEEVPLSGSKGVDNGTLYLDFFIPSKLIAIEVQGQQHYSKSNFYHKSQKDFISLQNRDVRKKEWCDINNITLIELKFDSSDEEWEQTIINR